MADKSVIKNIGLHVQQLIDDHRRLSKLCVELDRQCNELKIEKRKMQEQIKQLNDEVARLQLSEGLSGESQNRDKARMRVNRLMREVDKCIALLGKLDDENQLTNKNNQIHTA